MGDDEKIHFTNWAGADSVLPFSKVNDSFFYDQLSIINDPNARVLYNMAGGYAGWHTIAYKKSPTWYQLFLHASNWGSDFGQAYGSVYTVADFTLNKSATFDFTTSCAGSLPYIQFRIEVNGTQVYATPWASKEGSYSNTLSAGTRVTIKIGNSGASNATARFTSNINFS